MNFALKISSRFEVRRRPRLKPMQAGPSNEGITARGIG